MATSRYTSPDYEEAPRRLGTVHPPTSLSLNRNVRNILLATPSCRSIGGPYEADGMLAITSQSTAGINHTRYPLRHNFDLRGVCQK
jgi:hypothetical protein